MTRVPVSAADACVINALAALLVDGVIHPDKAEDLRGVVAEALPRVSTGNPDMTALAIAARDMLAGGRDDRRAARVTIGALLSTILCARAYEAWGRLQEDEGKNVEQIRKKPDRRQ